MSVKCICGGEIIFSIEDNKPANFPDKCPSCGTEFKRDFSSDGLIPRLKVITKSLASYPNMEFSLICEEKEKEKPNKDQQ